MSPGRDIRMIDSIVKKVGLSEDQRESLHEEFRRHYPETLTYQEILELARQIKRENPNK